MRSRMRVVSRTTLIAGTAAVLAVQHPVLAQAVDASGLQQDVDRMKLEDDQRDEQLRKLKIDNEIQAERVARIKDLGLPSFDGTAKLESNAGAMEVSLLASAALLKAARMIDDVKQGDMIIASGEAPPRGDIKALEEGQRQLGGALGSLPNGCQPPAPATRGTVQAQSLTAGTVIAAVSAVAGMFRADVTYSGIAATEADAAMFADMLAIEKKGQRRDTPLPVLQTSGRASNIAAAQTALEKSRGAAAELKAKIEIVAADKRTDQQKVCLAAASAALQAAERYDKIWIEPGADGDSRYQKTLRFLALLEGSTGIVQVSVQAGGTAVNSKNIATFFGGDPLRLNGQVIISWIRYDLVGGEIAPKQPSGGLIACASRRMSITDVYRFVRLGPASAPSARGPDVDCRRIRS